MWLKALLQCGAVAVPNRACASQCALERLWAVRRTALGSKTTDGQGKGFTETFTLAGASPAPNSRPRIALHGQKAWTVSLRSSGLWKEQANSAIS